MIEVYTVDQVARVLGCSTKTVEELARRGELTGIKPGGAWVFPAGALARRLDELALEQAQQRRKPTPPIASTPASAPAAVARRGKAARARPVLIDLRVQAGQKAQ